MELVAEKPWLRFPGWRPDYRSICLVGGRWPDLQLYDVERLKNAPKEAVGIILHRFPFDNEVMGEPVDLPGGRPGLGIKHYVTGKLIEIPGSIDGRVLALTGFDELYLLHDYDPATKHGTILTGAGESGGAGLLAYARFKNQR